MEQLKKIIHSSICPKKRNVLLGFILLIGLNQCQFRSNLSEREKTIYQIADFFWQAQASDGAWHSQVHGLLKGGQAFTPFIVHILAQVPDSIYPLPTQKMAQALQFIRQKMQAQLADNNALVLEYPVYSAAYSLQVLAKYGNKNDSLLIKKIAQYLVNQQFAENRNIQVSHPAYGAWGFGETRLAVGEVGHVDLSVTRRVLEALRLTKNLPASVKAKAQHFLYYMQKNPQDRRWQPNVDTLQEKAKQRFFDGGFYYSPVVLGANKAKLVSQDSSYQTYFRSYATATCDGLLAWYALTQNADNEALKVAKNWLLKNDDLNFPAGISPNDPEQWHQTLVLYHLAVRAEVYKKLKIKGDWQAKMAEILQKYQQKDGSFLNPAGARNKENDPLLGSALALLVLL
jgi:hypothetical protein